MQFDNQKTRNVADVAARIMAGESVEKEPEMLEEALTGSQHKIDANKNNKVDAEDFKILRAQKEKEKANSMKFGKDVKEEAEQVDEAMFPGTKEYQKKYGESPQQKMKKVGDKQKTTSGEMEKTATGVKHTRKFTEMVAAYKDGGLKTISEMFIKEEPDSDQYKKELDMQMKKASEKKSEDDEALVAKAKVDAVKVEEEVEQIDELSKSTLGSYVNKASRDASTSKAASANWAHTSTKAKNPRVKDAAAKYSDEEEARHNKRMAGIGQAVKKITKEEVEQIEEREMTDAEMKKREEIVKSMKKGMAGFKQRYGDRAKSVMYATATKQAMKD